MSSILGLEGLVMLAWWARVDREEGDDVVGGWFQWGYITRHGRDLAWYILIRLPSYSMEIPWYRDGRPSWHQRCLLFKEKVPNGIGEWRSVKWECR